ncbi:unnamed protein product [Vicia faba]|uniref:Uncharacterized protein n=1 Tax=Vicia faba TaxID=3906 RepID=A0AAV0ZRG4_VICFA|nr:unnamed protein product [Vicia faba]
MYYCTTFFGTSPLKNRWRVIYEYMSEQDMLELTKSKSFPSFNDSKHNIFCSELKQLYVAITRTRQRLWICENAEEFCRPMFDYWKRKYLVQFKELDDSLSQAMKVASSPEEWKSRGKKLYYQNNYEMAAQVYARGSFFSDCLNVCAKGGLFDIGLHYIHHWKQNESADPGWAKSHDLYTISLQEVAKLPFSPLDPREPDTSVEVFENLSPHVQACIPDLLKVALTCLENVADSDGSLRLSADQEYAVELIGGATRVPKLQAKLQDFLSRKELDWHLDADEAIVLGAALHAANINDGIINRITN